MLMRYSSVRTTMQFLFLVILSAMYPLLYGVYLLESRVISELYIQAKNLSETMKLLVQLL